ncbi:GTPase RsgA [Actinoplanes sp. TFC3]|uniref:GTPase RsgA n=1 Tax=Actinoplanes sp. TFC3 TaxID=1710355 RepID=UPI0009EACCD6|nr:GTPase RsgA [Actinoplanes sp. TFC3]
MSDLPALGWDAAVASAYRCFDRPDTCPGRVLRAERGVCTVLTPGGVDRASLAGNLLLSTAGYPADLPCAGDWVVVRRWPDRRTTVELVLPRRTALTENQPLAANVDTVAVVEPLHPRPDEALIGRLLTLARQSGAQPVIVLTKCDLARDPQLILRKLRETAPGVRTQLTSTRTRAGLDDLRDLVPPGRTLALLGRPGAGKSALVSVLVGAGAPTVPGSLIPLAGGGAVLDLTAGRDPAPAAQASRR